MPGPPDRSRSVVLDLVRRDALADPIPALPIPDQVELVGLAIGRCEDGSPWLLRLLGSHVLIAGATGPGEGSIIWSLIRALLPGILDGWVRVWACDPKRMELSFGRDLFARYADQAAEMVELLEAAVAEMHRRAAAQRREGWHLETEPVIEPDEPTEDQKWWVEKRAEAQAMRDQAEHGGQDTADLEELTAGAAATGSVSPGTARCARHRRSTEPGKRPSARCGGWAATTGPTSAMIGGSAPWSWEVTAGAR